MANKDEFSSTGEKKTAEEIQVVVFKLGGEEYAVEIHEVREIIKKMNITRIPNAPDFVEGVINLRGKIVVIIDLLKRFGTFDKEVHVGSHVIISEMDGNSFGIMVDDVSEVLKIPTEDIRKAQSILVSKIHSDYLKGICILEGGNRLLILIDLIKVLSEKEINKVGEVTQALKGKITQEQEAKRQEQEAQKPKITDEEIAQRLKERIGDQLGVPKKKARGK